MVEQYLPVAQDGEVASDASECDDEEAPPLAPLEPEPRATAHAVLSAGVLDKRLCNSEHVICNFVGANKNHVKQPAATAKLNDKYPHGHFKLRSSDVSALQIARGNSADLPSVAHLRIGRLVGRPTGRHSLNESMAEESLNQLSTALGPGGELEHVTNVIFPSLKHLLPSGDWSCLKGQLSVLNSKIHPKIVTVVEETGHFRKRLEQQAKEGLGDLAMARREARAYIDAEIIGDDELRDDYRRLADELHDIIAGGADSAVQSS
jgi:hypothetical protein